METLYFDLNDLDTSIFFGVKLLLKKKLLNHRVFSLWICGSKELSSSFSFLLDA